ncbi:MAG TPA: alpha/beta hydrolase [Actinomycetota bacterium]|nr:alpha/beta hydrolase [Actinomycetota bacterium]
MTAAPDALVEWRSAGRSIDVEGRDIFVVEQGSGDRAVLILHGFPGSSFDWHRVVPALARSFRVVAFDFLGYGLSAKPPDARYSLFEQADLAERVAAEVGMERCALVAHDMGDTVAAELLMRAVEGRLSFEVERAILTNGSIFIDLAQLSAGQLALLSLPDEVLPQPIPLEGFRPGLAETFSSQHQPSEDDLDAMVWLIARDGGDQLLPRLIRYIEERRANQERWTDGLVRFEGPLAALWGAQDPIAVPAMVQRLSSLRPDTDVVVWDDVGHWPSLEAPGRLVQAVTDRIGTG